MCRSGYVVSGGAGRVDVDDGDNNCVSFSRHKQLEFVRGLIMVLFVYRFEILEKDPLISLV